MYWHKDGVILNKSLLTDNQDVYVRQLWQDVQFLNMEVISIGFFEEVLLENLETIRNKFKKYTLITKQTKKKIILCMRILFYSDTDPHIYSSI